MRYQKQPTRYSPQIFSVRGARRIITFFYHLAILITCIVWTSEANRIKDNQLAEAVVFLFVLHVLTFRLIPVSRWLQELIISDAYCLGCGFVLNLRSRYRCSCGINPHYEKHAFSPCSNCGKIFSWMVCPRCDTTILI